MCKAIRHNIWRTCKATQDKPYRNPLFKSQFFRVAYCLKTSFKIAKDAL